MVTIRLVSYFKSIGKFTTKVIEIKTQTRIRELIDLGLPDDKMIIIINETKIATLDSFVQNDDYVMLSPLFGGG